MKTKTAILLTAIISTSIHALQAPDFVVQQMKFNPTPVFKNDYLEYAPIPGATATRQNTEAPASQTINLNPGIDSNSNWTHKIANWNLSVPRESQVINPGLSMASETVGTVEPPKVVFNYTTGNIAILTNELSVKTRDRAQAQAIASSHNLTLSFYSEVIKRAFYVAPTGIDMIGLANQINISEGLEVIIDIVEHEVVPN